MAKGQQHKSQGEVMPGPSKSPDHLGIRRAELLEIVCALVGDNDNVRQFTRDGIVQEAKQYLELIDNEYS